LSLRVAWSKHKDSIYYDLTDEKCRSIKISKDGWQTLNESPILFARYNQTTQIDPSSEYEADVFERFFDLTNVKDESGRLLLKIYIVSMFIPDIDHAMLILHGEKGSAKSTLQNMIKTLVDPAKPSLITIPTDKDEFVRQMNHNYVACYDNIKYIPKWFSDEACKAATGVGNTRRKLYTNDEDVVYEYKRCLGFNGIHISLTEPDALDRSILIQLDRIRRENNRVKTRIFTRFEELQPKLLGYIFDVLSRALSLKDSIELKDLPRLGDFAEWGEAIARAMEYRPLDFIKAYYKNIGKQNIEAVEAHPLGLAISKLYDELQENNEVEWFGSTAECLDKLNELADKHKINTGSRSWPKAVNSLSRSLKNIRSNLLEGLGIEVTIDRNTAGRSRYTKNTSTIKIRKISPLPPLSPPDQNQARILTKSGGDIIEGRDIVPPPIEIPPPKSEENQARIASDIGQSGDGGHSGGVIRNTLEGKGSISKVHFVRCPYCSFENIHPEVIAHHIKYGHTTITEAENTTL
jgi:hypothetical protein